METCFEQYFQIPAQHQLSVAGEAVAAIIQIVMPMFDVPFHLYGAHTSAKPCHFYIRMYLEYGMYKYILLLYIVNVDKT